MARIVETDNFDGDYPDEKFLNIPPLPDYFAKAITDAINAAFPSDSKRVWVVVQNDYVLRPGFEP